MTALHEPCSHKKKTIPAMMSMPKFGVVCLVECDDCKMVIGNCEWIETKPGVIELIFSPPEIGQSNDPIT